MNHLLKKRPSVRVLALLIASFLIHPLASAKDTALILSGGGQDQNSSFDSFNMSTIENYEQLRAHQWKISVLTADRVSHFLDQAQGKVQAADVKIASIQQLYSELESVRDDSLMHAGDQLLLWIDSHGSPGSFGLNATEHLFYSDRRLNELLFVLKFTKGLKIAFVNTACYSGTSLVPLRAYGCTLTSASSNIYSVMGAGDVKLSAASSPDGGRISMNDLFFTLLLAHPQNNYNIGYMGEDLMLADYLFDLMFVAKKDNVLRNVTPAEFSVEDYFERPLKKLCDSKRLNQLMYFFSSGIELEESVYRDRQAILDFQNKPKKDKFDQALAKRRQSEVISAKGSKQTQVPFSSLTPEQADLQAMLIREVNELEKTYESAQTEKTIFGAWDRTNWVHSLNWSLNHLKAHRMLSEFCQSEDSAHNKEKMNQYNECEAFTLLR